MLMPENPLPPAEAKTEEHPIADYYDGVRQLEMKGYESGIKNARTALFVTAALIFAGELITVSIAGLPITAMVLGIALIEAGIFVGLALWTKTKPYSAIMTGIVIFIGIWILAFVVSGAMGAISGILARIIILSYLISAVKPAKAWEQAKKSI